MRDKDYQQGRKLLDNLDNPLIVKSIIWVKLYNKVCGRS